MVHYVCRDLTLGCHCTVRRLSTMANQTFAALRILNNNAGSHLLYRVATSYYNLAMGTNPIRTATLNGVVVRLGTLKLLSSVARKHQLVTRARIVGACAPDARGSTR